MILVSFHMLNQGDYISSVPVVIFCVLKSGTFFEKAAARLQLKTKQRISLWGRNAAHCELAFLNVIKRQWRIHHGPELSMKNQVVTLSPISPAFIAEGDFKPRVASTTAV